MPATSLPIAASKLTRTDANIVNWNGQSLNRNNSGVGGLDTGVVAVSTLYYVYSVAGGIVASTSVTSPSGFSSYRKVGAFYTDATAQIFKAFYFGEIAQLMFSAKIASNGTVSDESADWITGNGTNANPRVLTVTGFSVTPNVTVITTDNTDNSNATISAASATSISVYTRTTGTASNQQPTHIHAMKQGIDASQPDWS